MVTTFVALLRLDLILLAVHPSDGHRSARTALGAHQPADPGEAPRGVDRDELRHHFRYNFRPRAARRGRDKIG